MANQHRKRKWHELTAELREKGYKCSYVNDHGFVRPDSDDWVTHHFGESCMTISVSDKLRAYTILDSGD